MRVIAFVGESGTGKSFRACFVAKDNQADAIIDDGLLISGTKVLAGISAKKSETLLRSIRVALFSDKSQAKEMRDAINNLSPECLMILGTSEEMAKRIAKTLGLPEIEKFIKIEDIATKEEIEDAKRMRHQEGKHIIPVPTFEIKQDFSGYFMHPSRLFVKTPLEDENEAKTIMRPTFSYLGDYTISDNVIKSLVSYEAMKIDSVHKVSDVNIRTTNHGAHLDVTVILKYGENIPNVSKKIQDSVKKNLEEYTQINIRRVHIFVKNLVF